MAGSPICNYSSTGRGRHDEFLSLFENRLGEEDSPIFLTATIRGGRCPRKIGTVPDGSRIGSYLSVAKIALASIARLI